MKDRARLTHHSPWCGWRWIQFRKLARHTRRSPCDSPNLTILTHLTHECKAESYFHTNYNHFLSCLSDYNCTNIPVRPTPVSVGHSNNEGVQLLNINISSQRRWSYHMWKLIYDLQYQTNNYQTQKSITNVCHWSLSVHTMTILILSSNPEPCLPTLIVMRVSDQNLYAFSYVPS